MGESEAAEGGESRYIIFRWTSDSDLGDESGFPYCQDRITYR